MDNKTLELLLVPTLAMIGGVPVVYLIQHYFDRRHYRQYLLPIEKENDRRSRAIASNQPPFEDGQLVFKPMKNYFLID